MEIALLQNHLETFCHEFAKETFEKQGEVWHASTGIPHPFCNFAFGKGDIDAELKFFGELPFTWFLNEDSEELRERGFHDAGIFQGIMAAIDLSMKLPELPLGCTIELVENERGLVEFTEVIGPVFMMDSRYTDVLSKCPNTYIWLMRKEGRAVSALATFIDGDLVSFWAGASIEEVRKQGLISALGAYAALHAAHKGCRTALTYLTSEAMALGICTKNGGEAKWPFHVFTSP